MEIEFRIFKWKFKIKIYPNKSKLEEAIDLIKDEANKKNVDTGLLENRIDLIRIMRGEIVGGFMSRNNLIPDDCFSLNTSYKSPNLGFSKQFIEWYFFDIPSRDFDFEK